MRIPERKYGDWDVIDPRPDPLPRTKTWECRCACGVVRKVEVSNLLSGKSQRCRACSGKLRRHDPTCRTEVNPTYHVWSTMCARCHNPRSNKYAQYGGRGIHVDVTWRGPGGFRRFIADMGYRPGPAYSLDRKDNDVGYNAANCRWVTADVQVRNRRSNHYVEIAGTRMTVSDWARRNGVTPELAFGRISRGWDPIRAGQERARRVRAPSTAPSRPENQALRDAIQRCHNHKHPQYPNYGGRGITVADAWRRPRVGYWAFLAEVGPRPSPQHSLDRIDNMQGYAPGNVRWALRAEQAQNRRITKRVTAFGKSQDLSAWSREQGIPRPTLEARIYKYGWPVEEALSKKKRPRRAASRSVPALEGDQTVD